GRTIKFAGQAGQQREDDDQAKGVRLRKRKHRGGSREHRDSQREAAAHRVGHASADEAREKVAGAIRAHRDAGLRDRESAPFHVEREERNDEGAEFVQEHTGKENPDRPWQFAQASYQAWLFFGGWVHKTKTLPTFRWAGFEKSGFSLE